MSFRSFICLSLTFLFMNKKSMWLDSNIIAKIQSQKDDQFPLIEPWIRYTLDKKRYNNLVKLLCNNKSL